MKHLKAINDDAMNLQDSCQGKIKICVFMSENFKIVEIKSDKKKFLQLLLIGDESETMIDRYLDHGNLYAGILNGIPITVCVALTIDDTTVEIKNLAVSPSFQRRGFGRRMLEHVEKLNTNKSIILGTGETPSTLRFYEKCGYRYSHRVPNFFTNNYSNPIIEEGVLLRDMIYLKKK